MERNAPALLDKAGGDPVKAALNVLQALQVAMPTLVHALSNLFGPMIQHAKSIGLLEEEDL